MAMKRVKVGVVGCGNISEKYLRVAKKFQILEVVACSDLIMSRARARAKEFGVPRACVVKQLLADPEIEIVLNLTNPGAHCEVALAALKAGKNVYGEKPMAIRLEDGRRMLETARAKRLLIGGAPDTFLGAGIQTCRKLIDDGAIGEPVGATAFMLCPGHESWHPGPEFYYQVGGGPMFDMGPYYLTALITLLGPVRRVTGSARITFPQRTITSKPKYGKKIKVEVPTHVAGVLDFARGPVATIVVSFDVCAAFGISGGAQVPFVEVYGSEGTITVPDPNCFGGPVFLTKAVGEPRMVRLTRRYAEENRSIGLADLAYALRTGRPHRANGEMTYHVLEIMHAIHEASRTGKHVKIKSACKRPAPLPAGLREGILDK